MLVALVGMTLLGIAYALIAGAVMALVHVEEDKGRG